MRLVLESCEMISHLPLLVEIFLLTSFQFESIFFFLLLFFLKGIICANKHCKAGHSLHFLFHHPEWLAQAELYSMNLTEIIYTIPLQ